MSTSVVETRKFTSSSSRGEGFGTDRDHELGAMLKEREREIEREHAGTVDARYTRSEERSESSREYGRGGGEASDGMRRHDRDYGRDNLGTYRPMMTSRNLVIQRSTYGGHPSWSYGGGDRVSRTTERRFGSSYSGLPAGSYANVTNNEVNTMRVSREKEKRDMQDLNERFASYIEKVRFLEAQNKKLSDELDKLKSSWGKETSAVKTMFQTELTEARRLMDDNERDKAKLELRNASLEDQVADLKARLDESNRIALQDKEKVERQNQQLSDYEAEINLLRRRVEGLENDRDRDRKQINHLTDNLNRARMDLDHETLQHIDSENRRQTLEDEIEFLRAVHDQEMKELAALVYRDTTTENREFWKNEMGQALREIQQVYDDKLDGMRGEMESFYNMKIQEFRTEVAKRPSVDPVYTKEVTSRMKTQMTELYDKISDLDGKNQHLIRELDNVRRTRDEREREWETENTDLKMEVSKLRAELDSILQELQSIMHTKLGLELEIAAYRKLLESEESRLTTIRTTDTTVIDSRGGGTQVDIDRERSRGQVDIDRDRDRVPIDERDRSKEDRNRGRVHIDERERSREDREKGRVQIDERDRSREDRDRGRIHIDERERDRERERERERERMKDRDYGRGGGYRESSGGRSYEREGGSRDRDMSIGRDRDFSGGRDRDFGGGRDKDLSGGRDRDSDFMGGGRSSSGGRSGGRGTMEPHITPRSDRRSYATPGADTDDDREAEGFVEDAAGNDQAKNDLGFLLKGEGTAKTSLQRSAKGPISIGECDQEGRFVEFENTGRKDEMLGGWMLRRSIDGADQPAFIFPDNYVLRPGSKIKIWSSDFKPISLPYGDLVSQVGKWGQGVNVITKLINPHGEERAIHTQRITYM